MTSTIVGMDVSEAEAKRLLAAVRRADEAIQKVREKRLDAIRSAMDAGIPRQRIADELGITRGRLYQILRGE